MLQAVVGSHISLDLDIAEQPLARAAPRPDGSGFSVGALARRAAGFVASGPPAITVGHHMAATSAPDTISGRTRAETDRDGC